MSSCLMNNPDSDEEVDLEALRLAALKSRKPKYAKRVNHNNLIPIVPVSVETPDFANTKIKVEKPSPPPEAKKQDETKQEGVNKENEEDKASNYSESTLNDQDILSMDDKEEEDSLERLMDQLEAEISGKVPLPTNAKVLSSKNSSDKKDKRKKSKKSKTDGDDEIELVQVKSKRDCETVIEIRESASPEPAKEVDVNKPSEPLKSPNRRSRSLIRSKSRTRSRSPFSRGRSYRRSRSPYWSRSPRRSRSPFRRSRSPFWLSRRSRSSSRKPRSPLRRYRSPGRNRSPFSRFSRSRSRSFDRRRSSWSLSPRRRSKSPYYRDSLPPRRNFNSPPGRIRRSFSPRNGSKSPRRRSRSPRGFARNSPFRRSKSPFRRSRSPFRRTKSLTRRSQSPFSHRSKSPISKLNSPLPKRSSPGKLSPGIHSKSPARRSLSLDRRPKSSERTSPKHRSKSPSKFDGSRRSPRHLPPKNKGSSKSPTSRRIRSPLRAVNERNDKPKDRNRNEKRHRSLSRENHKTHDRRPYRSRHLRRFSPSGNRSRKSADKDGKKSKSPKSKDASEKTKEETTKQTTPKDTTGPSPPLNPVLEARKKKFENLNVVDPTIDKKISLKSIKESTENVEDDEDALTINLEGNLWEESEESDDEFESRFKSGEAKKRRTVLSFRNLRENDPASRKIILNKPLVEENREKSGKSDGQDRWLGRRNERWRSRYHEGGRNRIEDNDISKSRLRDTDRNNVQSNSNARTERRSDRKPIVWSSKSERKRETESKTNEVTTTQSEVKDDKSKNSVKSVAGSRDKVGKVDSDLPESDDFDKLISDFEKELESDICLSTKEVNSTTSSVNQGDVVKKTKISLKKTSLEPPTSVEPPLKKHSGITVRASETCLNRLDKVQEDVLTSLLEDNNGTETYTSEDNKEGPEDYIEDDDFFLEDSTERKHVNKVEDEEDSQSDLRAVLSKRRNQRLTKVVSLQESMPTRLVQSAFQGLGDKKPKRQFRETQNPLELSSVDRNVKSSGGEGRRVLLLQRDRNPSMPAVKCTVPEVQPDTTIYQRQPRAIKRRKRKLQRQSDPNEDLDQEEEEEGFEVEEERQSRRFRLKRNVTLSSQLLVDSAEELEVLVTTVSNHLDVA